MDFRGYLESFGSLDWGLNIVNTASVQQIQKKNRRKNIRNHTYHRRKISINEVKASRLEKKCSVFVEVKICNIYFNIYAGAVVYRTQVFSFYTD